MSQDTHTIGTSLDGRASVGVRIKELRQQRGLTLRALGEQAGLSTGLLSQVERGVTDPSLQTLRQLARALQVPLFDLFSPPDTAPVAVVRRDQRLGLSAPHAEITYSRVSPGSGRLEVLEGTLMPGGASSHDPWTHASEECVLVTSGTLTVHVGDQVHVLAAGDSCYFDSRLPHRYVNDGARPAVFTLAVTPPSY